MTKEHTPDSPYRAASKPTTSRHGPSARGKKGGGRKRHASTTGHSHHTHHAASSGTAKKPASRGGRRRRGGKGGGKSTTPARHAETSHSTTRVAYADTRAWLLKEHGPVCAYCGLKFSARVMTLDHVAPRRGQTAYDRRDNLVLACRDCNAKKKDMAPLAFLLGLRSRAVNLLRYGAHLSTGLLDLARSLVPGEPTSGSANIDHVRWGAASEDEESPYRD